MNYPYKKGWWETKDHKKLKIKDSIAYKYTSKIERTMQELEYELNKRLKESGE